MPKATTITLKINDDAPETSDALKADARAYAKSLYFLGKALPPLVEGDLTIPTDFGPVSMTAVLKWKAGTDNVHPDEWDPPWLKPTFVKWTSHKTGSDIILPPLSVFDDKNAEELTKELKDWYKISPKDAPLTASMVTFEKIKEGSSVAQAMKDIEANIKADITTPLAKSPKDPKRKTAPLDVSVIKAIDEAIIEVAKKSDGYKPEDDVSFNAPLSEDSKEFKKGGKGSAAYDLVYDAKVKTAVKKTPPKKAVTHKTKNGQVCKQCSNYYGNSEAHKCPHIVCPKCNNTCYPEGATYAVCKKKDCKLGKWCGCCPHKQCLNCKKDIVTTDKTGTTLVGYSCNNCKVCFDEKCLCICNRGRHGYKIKVAPWIARGVKVTAVNIATQVWDNVWPDVDNANIDPVQSMAEFYLLEGISSMIFNGGKHIYEDEACRTVAAEAAEMYEKLTTRLDKSFMQYVDMVVGGELRHHRAVGGIVLMTGDRPRAWAQWKIIRDAGGPDVLLDAAELFEDFNERKEATGGYGGARWAAPCRLLHQRLTGTLTPAQWVDRAFTLEHNGGCLFNKIEWKQENQPGWGINMMSTVIGPAHAAKEIRFGVLLAASRPEVRDLFDQWWRTANAAHRANNKPREAAPTWAQGGRLVHNGASRLGWQYQWEEPGAGRTCQLTWWESVGGGGPVKEMIETFGRPEKERWNMDGVGEGRRTKRRVPPAPPVIVTVKDIDYYASKSGDNCPIKNCWICTQIQIAVLVKAESDEVVETADGWTYKAFIPKEAEVKKTERKPERAKVPWSGVDYVFNPTRKSEGFLDVNESDDDDGDSDEGCTAPGCCGNPPEEEET